MHSHERFVNKENVSPPNPDSIWSSPQDGEIFVQITHLGTRKVVAPKIGFQILLELLLSQWKPSQAQKRFLLLFYFEMIPTVQGERRWDAFHRSRLSGWLRWLSDLFPRANTCSLRLSISRADGDTGVRWMPSVWQSDSGRTSAIWLCMNKSWDWHSKAITETEYHRHVGWVFRLEANTWI